MQKLQTHAFGFGLQEIRMAFLKTKFPDSSNFSDFTLKKLKKVEIEKNLCGS